MKWLLLLVALGAETATAVDHTHHLRSAVVEDAQIVLTINPEARVSAELSAPLPSPRACGAVADLKIKVINQGFVTAPLRAVIVGGGRDVTLQLDGAKLSGGPEDRRTLHLMSRASDPVDVTIAFSIDQNVGDLAGRDRIHFLLRCEPVAR